MFLDAVEFPDAYRLGGRYTVAGETVTVTVNVFQGKTRISQLKATGLKNKLDELADQISRDVEKLLAEKAK